MNSFLSFTLLAALIQMSLSVFGAEITQMPSTIKDVQTLLEIADEFLYCFIDKSYKEFPDTGKAYADAVTRVMRSFSPQNNTSLMKTEAIVFQTSLATSIADIVAIEYHQNDHPQIHPTVLQLISDCFTEITGYEPSELIRNIASFLELSLENIDPERNYLQVGHQEILTEDFEREKIENEIQLEISSENSEPEHDSTNEINQIIGEKRPTQPPQSFSSDKSTLIVRNSNFNPSILGQEVSDVIELDPLPNHGKQNLIKDGDSLQVKPEDTPYSELKGSQRKHQLIISPPFRKYDNSNLSVMLQFSTIFSDAVDSSGDLSKAFETSLHPVLASKTYYKTVYNAVFGIKYFNPVSISRIIAMAVKATFQELTTFQHIMIYGNVVGNYLNLKGLLTPENLVMLSHTYIDFISTALTNVKTSDIKESNIQAIIDGLFNFLEYLKVFPSESLLDFATDFSDNFFFVTGIKRSIYHSLLADCEDFSFNKSSNVSPNFKPNLEENSISVISNSKDDMHTCCISGNSKSCSLPSAISLFTEIFSETVFLSEILTNACERRSSGIFSSEILYSVLYDYLLNLGIDYSLSQFISKTVSQWVNKSLYAMTPVVITHSISETIARKLFDENLLSLKNFEQLSDSYIQFLELSFRSLELYYPTESIFRVILEASGNFLFSQKVSVAENAEILAIYFGNALNSWIQNVFTNREISKFDEVLKSSDFDFLDEFGEAYLSEQFTPSIFSEYILNEILFYPILSNLFYLPTTPSNLYESFDRSSATEAVDSYQRLVKLILHEITKTSGNLDSISFTKLYIKSLEKFLTARSVLKPENTITMARAFVSAMTEAARQKKDSDFNLNIIINTTGRFLEKCLIFGLHLAESWSSMFLTELSSLPNFPLRQLIKKVAPDVLSQRGLLSMESLIRVENLASSIRRDILFSEEIDVKSFIYNLTSGATQISQKYPESKSGNVLIQTFLEGIAALIGVINGAYITTLDISSYGKEVREMYETFSDILNV